MQYIKLEVVWFIWFRSKSLGILVTWHTFVESGLVACCFGQCGSSGLCIKGKNSHDIFFFFSIWHGDICLTAKHYQVCTHLNVSIFMLNPKYGIWKWQNWENVQGGSMVEGLSIQNMESMLWLRCRLVVCNHPKTPYWMDVGCLGPYLFDPSKFCFRYQANTIQYCNLS